MVERWSGAGQLLVERLLGVVIGHWWCAEHLAAVWASTFQIAHVTRHTVRHCSVLASSSWRLFPGWISAVFCDTVLHVTLELLVECWVFANQKGLIWLGGIRPTSMIGTDSCSTAACQRCAGVSGAYACWPVPTGCREWLCMSYWPAADKLHPELL